MLVTVLGPVIVTGMPATPSPAALLTWMPSVPWLVPNAPTGGATRLDIFTGGIGVLISCDSVIEVIRM